MTIFSSFCSETPRSRNISKGRSSSINGVHLILKKWEDIRAISQISFHFFIYILQIHGLPPVFMPKGMAKRISEMVGKINLEYINKRCVVARRFLRIKVDLDVRTPLPPGLNQDKEEGEIWIQFYYERLPDVRYKCGMTDHVNRKMHFR